MSRISDVFAFEAFDSRGTPTVAATVTTDDDCKGTALVPSGASVGSQEAVELRDGDVKRLQGRGVESAVAAITEEIRPALLGRNVDQQSEIDKTLCELDGTDNKQRIGANAILGVSLANAHAAARSSGVPLYKHINSLAQNPAMTLPIPQLNVLNGGAHANNNVDIQEFMVIPAGLSDFQSALRCAAEIFFELKQLLNARGLSTSVGDEGGFAPDLPSNDEALEFLLTAVDNAHWESGCDVYLGLDCAATEFFDDGHYVLNGQNKKLTPQQWIEEVRALLQRFPAIVSIEDGIHETDYLSWQQLNELIGGQIQLVGDDLFVTNADLLRKGIEDKLANSILVKLNQIGTLSETLEVIKLAKDNGFGTVISHRSGDTEDTTIADLAVGTGAGQIKTGSMSRSERVAKYNRLLQIELELEEPVYAGTLRLPWR